MRSFSTPYASSSLYHASLSLIRLLYQKKRRPQISTNHPTMRTGEISKVLSKEWQTMAKTEKQYYQDKAKK